MRQIGDIAREAGWDDRRVAHEKGLIRDAREERFFRERSENRPRPSDRAPYWVWEMFDNQVPSVTHYGCTSKIPPMIGDW